MKAVTTVSALMTVTLSLVAMPSPASAVLITFSTTGGPEHIFFEGTDHSVTVQLQGSAAVPPYLNQIPLDLEYGVPLTNVFVNSASVIPGDWPGIFPNETQTMAQTITVGSVSGQLNQDVMISWINNNQAQENWFPSETVTLDLGPVGLLDVTLEGPFAGQFQANSAGGGANLPATFLLTPEPTTLALLALGGLAVRRRRRYQQV